MDYWNECISEAFEDAGLKATPEQIDIVASWIQGAHENYGMAHGHDCIPNPLAEDNKRLRKELKIEQDKIPCTLCNSHGRLISQGPVHSSESECWQCRGEGRHTR